MCVALAAAGVAAAGAVGGSLISSSASKSAANTQAQSAQDASQAQLAAANNSIAAQQQGQEAAQANQQPWINAGSAALSQLGNLLGIQISPSSQFSDTSTQYGGGSSAGGSGNALVTMQNGVPAPNMALYNNNPQYKAVWDSVSAANQARFGTGYTTGSNPTMLTKELTDGLNNMGINPATLSATPQSSTSFQPGTMYGGPTGGFAGSNGNSASALQTLQNTPGYQFTLDQGMKAIENSAAARGMQLSGATLQDLNNYAQGQAQTTYQQDVGNLMQLAGFGNSAAGGAASGAIQTGGNIGSTITGAGNSIGSNIIGAGNATAAGQVGAANAISGGLNSAGQMYQLSQLFGTGGGTGGDAGVPGWSPATGGM